MIGTFDLQLTLLSLLVGFITFYITLNVAEMLKERNVRTQNYWLWLISGSLVVGSGLWAMHFIGMEAYQLPFIPEYDPFLNFISRIIIIATSCFILFWSSFSSLTVLKALIGAIPVTIGVLIMHYLNIASMRHIEASYNPLRFVVTSLLCFTTSAFALWSLSRSVYYHWSLLLNFFVSSAAAIAMTATRYFMMFAVTITLETFTAVSGVHFHHEELHPFYLVLSSAVIMVLFLGIAKRNEKHLADLNKAHDELLFKSEALKIALDKAERASHTKSEFLANMSHEIRTPLNVIVGSASLLDAMDLSDKARRCSDRITIACRALFDVILEILNFTKIESGEIAPLKSPTDIKVLAEESIKKYTPYAQPKKIRIYLDNHLPPNFMIATDPVWVQQVLDNLITNAIKFSERGDVRVKFFTIEREGEQKLLRCEVADQGIGIDRDEFNLVFNKFFQSKTALSKNLKGVGLGLAVCKKAIDLLNGKIGFESEPGKGSTFWFELPL